MYMALKSNQNDFEKNASILCDNPDPKFARTFGTNQISLRKDWDDIKYDAMYFTVYNKFFQNRNLAVRLIETYPNLLVESNYWHDNY